MAYVVRQKVFVCYAHEDQDKIPLLRRHIASTGLGWEAWDDSQIPPGADWRKKIEVSLREARAAVLLVSADFLSSEFIQKSELPLLMRRAKSDRFTLIPVQIRPTHAHHSLSSHQFLNPPESPVSEMDRNSVEKLWVRLAERLLCKEPVEDGLDDEGETTGPDDEEASAQPHMRVISKKLLKALVGFQKEVRGKELDQGLIGYKDLFVLADLGFTRRWAGVYLYEIHEWCRTNNWPPLNALVVNSALRRPGGAYPGDDWEREAMDCMEFSYPAKVLSPP